MSDLLQLPLSQQTLYAFIAKGEIPSPQEIYELSLANFSAEAQSIINAPGNPYGTMMLTSAVATSAAIAKMMEINSNLLFTDSDGEWLRKNLFNFGMPPIPASSTQVKLSLEFYGAQTIPASYIFVDDAGNKFASRTPLVVPGGTNTRELTVYSLELGPIPVDGEVQPEIPLQRLSSSTVIEVLSGKNAEKEQDIKLRLENSNGAKIFGTTAFVTESMLMQPDYIVGANIMQNNRNTAGDQLNTNVDANSIFLGVRPLILPTVTGIDTENIIEIIGEVAANSLRGGQKLTQPPGTAVNFAYGFADEAALNDAGYTLTADATNQWGVYTPPGIENGKVCYPIKILNNQELTINVSVSFLENATPEQKSAAQNTIKRVCLELTPVIAGSFAPAQISDYIAALALAGLQPPQVSFTQMLLSIDGGPQNVQSLQADGDKFLFLPGTIEDGTAITSNVIITEV